MRDVDRENELMLFGLDNNSYSLKGVRLLCALYLGSMVFAAIFSPIVYSLIQWLNSLVDTRLLSYLSGKSFADYFDRLRWLPIVCGLPWLMKSCGLSGFKKLGLDISSAYRRLFLSGYVGGGFLLGMIILGQFINLNVQFIDNLAISELTELVLLAFVGSFLVAVLEEIVFRGLIFRIFYVALKPMNALLLSALFFSYVHFKFPDALWEQGDQIVHWYSGFYVGFWSLLGIFYEFEFLPFLNLFLLGLALALFYVKTHSLLSSIGFHMGAVFIMLVYKKCFAVDVGHLFWVSRISTNAL